MPDFHDSSVFRQSVRKSMLASIMEFLYYGNIHDQILLGMLDLI